MKKIFIALFAAFTVTVSGQYNLEIAVLKYKGGGDWYANPTSLKNLALFCNQNLGTAINPDYATVEPGDPGIFAYPFVHMTGHGNVVFMEEEIVNLRKYLLSGGFLHIDDNYGMDPYIREQIKKLFPEYELTPLPSSHAIYHQQFKFPQGLPKIHEHDNNPPEGLAIVHEGRVVLYYTHETDLGNGWEDQNIHNDPEEKRQQALKMGANIIQYIFTAN